MNFKLVFFTMSVVPLNAWAVVQANYQQFPKNNSIQHANPYQQNSPRQNETPLQNDPKLGRGNREDLRIGLEPLGYTLNPLSVAPSFTVGAFVSLFVYKGVSLDGLIIKPVLNATNAFDKTLYAGTVSYSFNNGATLRLGMGYKTTVEKVIYERIQNDVQTAAIKNCFAEPAPLPGNLSQKQKYSNCHATINAASLGLYASVGIQIMRFQTFGANFRLFSVYFPIADISASKSDPNDPNQKGLVTPRDFYDVSTLGFAWTFSI